MKDHQIIDPSSINLYFYGATIPCFAFAHAHYVAYTLQLTVNT